MEKDESSADKTPMDLISLPPAPTTTSHPPGTVKAPPLQATPRHTSLETSANKIVRTTFIKKQRREKKLLRSRQRRERQRQREELGDEAPPVKVPRTIESSRVYDEDTGQPLTREQVRAIEDEFTATLNGEVKPKVVITTGVGPTACSLDFIADWLPVCPDLTYFERKQSSIQAFVDTFAKKGFTDVIIVKEDKEKLSTFSHIHLPAGPTAIYKLSSYVPSKSIPNRGKCTKHTPELILNNFGTQLGVRVGRMLAALFPHYPNFVGRQAVTFHNQRDFIFFRFHRYIFNEHRDKARLQELGPRFTLKLRALQKGLFQDPEKAEHEFRWKTKTDRNRRRFFL